MGIFLFAASRPDLEPTQPPIQCEPGVRRPGLDVDHTPPPIAEVKNTWHYTFTPNYASMTW